MWITHSNGHDICTVLTVWSKGIRGHNRYGLLILKVMIYCMYCSVWSKNIRGQNRYGLFLLEVLRYGVSRLRGRPCSKVSKMHFANV